MIISIILAAGEGKRMKSKIPKVLHKMCGKPLLSYVIKASEAAGINKNVIIISNGSKDLVESVKDETVIFKEQPVGGKRTIWDRVCSDARKGLYKR